MNRQDFQNLYGHLSQKTKVMMICKCGRKKLINREKAEENINNHEGVYICRSCSMKDSHATNPRPDTTKEKQRQGRLGKKHTQASKDKLSALKKAFWLTPEGQELKKYLARLTTQQHARTDMNKSKRKVLYISAKNNNEIRVCNSSGEFVACEDFLEKDINVVSYETQVGYEINNRVHSLDFLITLISGTKKVIEVKPKKRMGEQENIQQIKDSQANAQRMGWEFELWTEPELKIKNWKEARNRADAYVKEHYLIDYAAYRAEKNKQKVKRHYDSKIAKDTVLIYCDFCKMYHKQLRVTYNRNIKKNGQFICIVENGHIVGSKPKTHRIKENPYADIDKKQCTGICKRILPFDCFSPDKSRRDGYCSQCKECRAKKAIERYRNKH